MDRREYDATDSRAETEGVTRWRGEMSERSCSRFTRLAFAMLLVAWPGFARAAQDVEPPSTPTGLAGSQVTATQLTLSWQPSSDNVRVTAYEVFKDGKASGSVTGASKTFSGLTPLTRYSLAVRAKDAKGNSSPLSAVLEVTTGPDVVPPSTPGGLQASQVGLKSVLLQWSASVDNVKVTAYDIFKDGTWLVATGGRSKSITGLSPATSYELQVRARDAAGNCSELSERLGIVTLADVIPPAVPGEVKVSSTAATKFLLRWAGSKDDVKVTGYEISVDGARVGATATTSFTVGGLVPARNYGVAVRAGDAAGNWSAWSEPVGVLTAPDTTKPTAPGGLVASEVSADRLRLDWSPATDNVAVTGYEVARDGVAVGLTAEKGFRLSGLQPLRTYALKVRARDAAGNWSGWSPALKVKTVALASPPAVPQGVVGTIVNPTSCVLRWSRPPEANSDLIYEVFRDGLSCGHTSGTEFELTGLLPGVRYFLSVRAGDGAGHWSELSQPVSVRFDGVPFLATFEGEDGYRPAALDRQNGWSAAGSAHVVTGSAYRGTQSLTFEPGAGPASATQSFGVRDRGVIFIDLWARPAAASLGSAGIFLETESTAVAFSGGDGQGRFSALAGDGLGGGEWRAVGGPITLTPLGSATDWLRLTIRSDYEAKRWDLFLNGRPVALDLGFRVAETGALPHLTLRGGDVSVAAFDEVLVARENPLFADEDADGLSDQWEEEHGSNVAMDDRHGDADGDGVSNLAEYWAEISGDESPELTDSDGDHLPDAWELLYGLETSMAADAAQDFDGDGRSNGAEYRAGTNPIDFYNGRAISTPVRNARAIIAEYSYDLSGRLRAVHYSHGGAVEYTYDPAGNLTRLRGTEPPIVLWRIAHGLPADGSGTGADEVSLAGDGLSNLAKYAFGLDPRLPFAGELPAVGVTRSGGRRYLVLSYRRPRPAPTDVTYEIELSVNGGAWAPAGEAVEVSEVAGPGEFATVTVQDRTPMGESSVGRRMRLRIERTE